MKRAFCGLTLAFAVSAFAQQSPTNPPSTDCPARTWCVRAGSRCNHRLSFQPPSSMAFRDMP